MTESLLPFFLCFLFFCFCVKNLKGTSSFSCRFTLIKEHLVEFNQLAMANAEGSDNMLNRVMPKDNIGLAALLRTKEAAWDNGEYSSDEFSLDAKSNFCVLHRKLHYR